MTTSQYKQNGPNYQSIYKEIGKFLLSQHMFLDLKAIWLKNKHKNYVKQQNLHEIPNNKNYKSIMIFHIFVKLHNL
jgi:hypothetical protein